jgi:hypothetical protein
MLRVRRDTEVLVTEAGSIGESRGLNEGVQWMRVMTEKSDTRMWVTEEAPRRRMELWAEVTRWIRASSRAAERLDSGVMVTR